MEKTMAKKKLWFGTTECDVCGKEIKKTLYDAKTVYGPWATMCESCFRKIGVGMALGLGQKYKKNKDGEFEKIEGLLIS